MKKMKFIGIAILAFVLCAGAAYAQNGMMRGQGGYYGQDQRWGEGYGYGPRTNYESDYDTQSRRKLQDMWQTHVEETAPLRNKLDSRYRELQDEMYREEPNTGRINDLINEINDFSAELFEKSTQFKVDAYQKTGIPYRGGYGPGFCPGPRYGAPYMQHQGRGYNRDYGRGMMDMPPGMSGPGMGRPGMGPGMMGPGMMRNGRY